jgi:hypothetical protein
MLFDNREISACTALSNFAKSYSEYKRPIISIEVDKIHVHIRNALTNLNENLHCEKHLG